MTHEIYTLLQFQIYPINPKLKVICTEKITDGDIAPSEFYVAFPSTL
jgi:hypothetical protein